METILYLVRHAQSHVKASLRHSEWPLSTKGLTQAEQLTPLLATLGIEQIVSSPFARCLQTIQPFAKKYGFQVSVIDGLHERLLAKELVNNFEEIWRKSWEDFDFALPECESSAAAQNRFVNAIEEILNKHTGKTIAVSSHGNVIALFLNWIDNKIGQKEADQLTNPDVLKISVRDGIFKWERDFHLKGLERITTDQYKTPIERDA